MSEIDSEFYLGEADIPPMEPTFGPLTFAQWDVLRHQATRDTLPLIIRLGAFHGAWPMPRNSSECPLCGDSKPGQRALPISETDISKT